MKLQFEPVGQERLPHQPPLLWIGVGPRFDLNIVAFGVDPDRTSYDLRSRQGTEVAEHWVVVFRVRELNEKQQGRVSVHPHTVSEAFTPGRSISFDRH